MKNLVLTVAISIILSVFIISLVNVGLSIILERPEFQDYCGEHSYVKLEDNITKEICTEQGGKWENGYCDYYAECSREYDSALASNNQARYYVLAGVGFLLLLFGLFSKDAMFQVTGLLSGTILVIEGLFSNLQNKVIVFFSILVMLVVFGILARKIIK